MWRLGRRQHSCCNKRRPQVCAPLYNLTELCSCLRPPARRWHRVPRSGEDDCPDCLQSRVRRAPRHDGGSAQPELDLRHPTAERAEAALELKVALSERNLLRRCCFPDPVIRPGCSPPGAVAGRAAPCSSPPPALHRHRSSGSASSLRPAHEAPGHTRVIRPRRERVGLCPLQGPAACGRTSDSRDGDGRGVCR